MGDQSRQIPKACDQCGGGVVLRRGPFSNFLGCANYPRCRFQFRLTESEAAAIRGDSAAADRVTALERRVAELERIVATLTAGKSSAKAAAGIAKTGRQGARKRRRTPAEARAEAMLQQEFRQIIG